MWDWLLFVGFYAATVILYNAVFLHILADSDERVFWILFLAFSVLWFLLSSAPLAWDFPQFYIAAKMPAHLLYNNAAYTQFGRTQLAPLGVNYYPGFLRPAVFVPLLKPLGWFTYWHAFWIWEAVVFVSYSVAVWLLISRFKLPKALIPAFALFFPALASIPFGQDIDVYFLVLLTALIFLIDGNDIAAGVLLALCTYKYHLVLLILVVLVVHRRWRTLQTFAILAAGLAAVSAVLAPPRDYVSQLLSVPHRAIGFVPGGIRGELMRMNHESWYLPIALLGLTVAIYLICRLPLKEGLAVAISGVLLCQYYGSWYDCTLLAIPIAIAWQHAGPFARKLLLALLPFPLVWLLGSFQVLAQCFLLTFFAVWAWKQHGRDESVTQPRAAGV